MKRPCLSVIVPAYNEEATLLTVIRNLLALDFVQEIIVVDDCSTDRTLEIANAVASDCPKVKVLHHSVNQGKTEALKTGFQASQGEIVIVQDADLEYNPEEIAGVIEPILDGNADVCFGSRFLVRKTARVLYFYHFLANKFLTFLSNMFTNLNMSDVETGYKAFRGEIIRSMIISSEGFGFEIEVTAKVAKLHCTIYEVPISYYGRTYEQGKKIGLKDGIAAIGYIFKYNLFTPLDRSFRDIPQAERSLTRGTN
jgi:glycosyltransferase involved in cell wall biosynthesis